jgi:hypothetical protein
MKTQANRAATRPVPQWRRRADLALLGLAVLAAPAIAGGLGPARPVVVLLAALLVPGGAAVTLLDVPDLLTAAALAVGLSLALEIVGSLALVWSTFWHPAALAIGLGVAAAAVLGSDLVRLERAARRPAA